MIIKSISSRPNWSEESVLDPKTGKYRNRYFYKGIPAQRIPITSRLAERLAGYTMIERDLRTVKEWIDRVHLLSKDQLYGAKEGWALTEKSDSDHNLGLGLFVAAVTFYGKCFTQRAGRKVKLDRRFVASELRETHDIIVTLRNNLAAHSGSEGLERAQIVAVLNPERLSDAHPILLVRESFQSESWLFLDPDHSFSRLVERVRESVLKKLQEINDKIFAGEINPQGLDYWYSQKQY